MASVTLAESAKLSQDMLISGVIENVVTTNPIFQFLPFTDIEGNALTYNRENALGDAQFAGVGTTITAKAAATFTQVTTPLTTIVGDAEVNGLIQATRSNITDQKATQIASKAKSIARQYQNTMITGDGTSNSFTGLASLCSAGQKVATATDGSALSFDLMDQLLDLVKAKDGEVDFLMMPSRTLRAYYTLLRALGGAGIGEVIQLPGGKSLPGYRGVPIFRNDWIPVNGTKGSGTALTNVYAGCFDDGSGKVGVAGLNAMGSAGIRIKEVGEKETADETITRLTWYTSLALFSDLALASIIGITN